jgi:hypothetical protein
MDKSVAEGVKVQLNPYEGRTGIKQDYLYLARFALAWGKGCKFLKEGSNNPYHVYNAEPGEAGLGGPFALQNVGDPSRCRGGIVGVNESNGLLHGEGNSSGCYQSDLRVPQNQFQFAATGVKDLRGAWLYKIHIVHGIHAGKCLNIERRDTDVRAFWAVAARECERTPTMWSSTFRDTGGFYGRRSGYVLRGYKAMPDARPEGTMSFHGALDLIGGANNGEVEVNDDSKLIIGQMFHYRPPGQAT